MMKTNTRIIAMISIFVSVGAVTSASVHSGVAFAIPDLPQRDTINGNLVYIPELRNYVEGYIYKSTWQLYDDMINVIGDLSEDLSR